MPRRWMSTLIVVCGFAVPTLAQDAASRPSTPESDPQNPMLWNAEAMMETAVQQLSRRYSLNPTQEEFTRKLLKTRVRAFLKDHESDLRGLLAEAIELQLNPGRVDSDRMQQWSQRALPVFNAARTAILDGNKDWGDTLNPDQRKIHQMDLSQMDVNFKMMDEKFSRWSQGGFKPEDLYAQPPVQVAGARTPRPGAGPGTAGQVSPRAVQSNVEDFWDAYVNQTIAIYKYSDEQSNSARAILTQCREKAAKHREANKPALDEIQKKIEALSSVTDAAEKQKQYAALQKRQSQLLAPIQKDIYEELKTRVTGLATDEQRAAVDAARGERMKKTEEARKAWQEKGRELSKPGSANTGAAKPEGKDTGAANLAEKPAEEKAPTTQASPK